MINIRVCFNCFHPTDIINYEDGWPTKAGCEACQLVYSMNEEEHKTIKIRKYIYNGMSNITWTFKHPNFNQAESCAYFNRNLGDNIEFRTELPFNTPLDVTCKKFEMILAFS